MPSGSPNAMVSVKVASQVREALHETGVSREAITGATYRAAGDKRDAEIFLSFTRYVATASPCGVWTQNVGKSFSNRTTPNFGCATQNNLAAMVADPRDLITPRGMTPADVGRRSFVLDTYRQGQRTSTEKDEQATGVLSEAVE